MSEDVASDLVRLARLVEITATNGFVVGTSKPVVVEDSSKIELTLGNAIYENLYTRRGEPSRRAADPRASRALLARYSAANNGHGTFESGWQITRVDDDGRYIVTKLGIDFCARRDELRSENENFTTGAPVRVAVPKEMCELLTGYYLFFGNALGGPEGRPGALARFYFHITEDGGPTFVASVSRLFNAANIPFRAKVIRISGGFLRADSAVLYLERTDVERALPELRLVYAALRGCLRESTPMLTLQLAPGLGVADDPGPVSDTFGQNRCMLVARGLLASYTGKPPTPEERLAGIVRAFQDADVSVVHPHLHNTKSSHYPKFLEGSP